MQQLARLQMLFEQWLNGHRLYSLTYEDLLNQGSFTPAVTEVFAEAFGCLPTHELKPRLGKILPPLSQVVENGDCLVDFFAGTEFEACVRGSILNLAKVVAGETKVWTELTS
jgi:hypothetical protein